MFFHLFVHLFVQLFDWIGERRILETDCQCHCQHHNQISSKRPTQSTTPPWILSTIVLSDTIFVSWWLPVVFQVWANDHLIPLTMKRQRTIWAWQQYMSLHTRVVCNMLGFYKDQNFKNNNNHNNSIMSNEYKALLTLLYPM